MRLRAFSTILRWPYIDTYINILICSQACEMNIYVHVHWNISMCMCMFAYMNSFTIIYLYVYIYANIHIYIYHHHHHIALVAWISLTLSRHSSLSFIALGRSSGQHPVSSHSCWMYVRAGRPAFARPCVGIHKSTSLMSSSLLLQQCPIYIYIYSISHSIYMQHCKHIYVRVEYVFVCLNRAMYSYIYIYIYI